MHIIFGDELTVSQSVLYTSPNAPCVPTELIARSGPTDTAPFPSSPVCYVQNKPMHIIFGYELSVTVCFVHIPKCAMCANGVIARSIPTNTVLFPGIPVCYV